MSTMSNEAPASARQQLVEVAGIPGYMTTKTGGERTAEASKAYDGGQLEPEVMSAPAETGNITVTKLYRPGVHGRIVRELDRKVGRHRTTVSIYDTDPDLGPVGEPRVYANALLVGVTWPDMDAGSSDTSSFELVFAVSGLA